MKTKIDLNNWNRRSHFYFFKDYDNPFYNICCNIEITTLHNFCRENKASFFLTSLFLATSAANQIEELKYRIEGDEVYCYDKIHPYSTILKDDNTFIFCEFTFNKNYRIFKGSADKIISNEKKKNGSLSSKDRNDVIHFTTIPWISLTSISHARNFNTCDSIPKMVFGKFYKSYKELVIPFSIEVNHALVDGYHIGQFLEKFEELIQNCDKILG